MAKIFLTNHAHTTSDGYRIVTVTVKRGHPGGRDQHLVLLEDEVGDLAHSLSAWIERNR